MFGYPRLPAWMVPLAAMALCGCETARAITTCPAPVEYSRDFLAGAADELDALPEGSKLGQMVEDYAGERAALRACRKG